MQYATFAMNTAFLIARCGASAMALYATARHPYDFYVLTRWSVFAVCCWGVWIEKDTEIRSVRALPVPAYLAIGVIFNPFLPFHFARSTWQFVDVLAGIILMASVVVTQIVKQQKPREFHTATMTVPEAEHIIAVAAEALTDDRNGRGWPHIWRPMSLLQGHDVFQIDSALKLGIANEFLCLELCRRSLREHPEHCADEHGQEEKWKSDFEKYVQACGVVPWHIDSGFVPDEDLAKLEQLDPRSWEYQRLKLEIAPSRLDVKLKDERRANLETRSSFANYCRSVGAEDPLYWQKIYTRIGLEYTSTSPKGNAQVIIEASQL